MRLDPHLPVIAATLLLAAAAQELAPLGALVPVKPVFLTAAALYYGLTRPALAALTALVWAGALTDALGGLPLFCTLSFLLAAAGAARLLQRVFLEAAAVPGALLVAVAAVAQALWTRAWAQTGEPLLAWATLRQLGAAAPAGFVAGLAVFSWCRLADRLAGLAQPVKEGHGLLWAETNR